MTEQPKNAEALVQDMMDRQWSGFVRSLAPAGVTALAEACGVSTDGQESGLRVIRSAAAKEMWQTALFMNSLPRMQQPQVQVGPGPVR